MARSSTLLLTAEQRAALGTCFRELRRYAFPNKTQTVVAEDELGVSQSTLCQIEVGKAEPSIALVHKAARIYGVHPNIIFGVVSIREMPLEAALDVEIVSGLRLQDALGPDQREEIRERLQRLGYSPVI